MKRKFSKILGVALTVALLVSLILAAAPVSGRTLEWGKEVIVKEGTVASPKTVVTGTDVLSLSAGNNGKTLWAVAYQEDIAGEILQGGYVLRSTTGGATFSMKSPKLGDVYDDIAVVAVSSDDPTVVVAAGKRGDDNYVFLSTDNGETWSASNVQDAPGLVTGTITCVDISEERDDYRWIAVGDDAGNLAVATAEAFAGWSDATTMPWGSGWAPTEAVRAVKFSPKFDYDGTFLAVTVTGLVTGADTELQIADVTVAAGGARWNAGSYPATVISGIPAGKATLALPDTYYGVEPAERVAYIGTNSGAYRMEDDSMEVRLKTGNWSAVAYDSEDNKLLLGSGTSGRVDMSENPDSGSPTFARPSSLKSASGEEVRAVAWVGSAMVAGTWGDESAVSVSTDARSWNGLCVIDTDLAAITDVAVAEDGSVIYLASKDGTYVSVWRKASTWERVLCEDYGSAAPDVILRLAPGKSEVIFLAQVGTDEIRASTDSGDKWKRAKSDILVKDMAARNETIVHTMNGSGHVSTSVDGGRTFDDYVKSNVTGDQMIVEPVTGDVIVIGAYLGFVTASISTDDGASFTRTEYELGIPDSLAVTFVAADGDYADNGIIYAAQDNNISRWAVGGDYEDWKDITPTWYSATDGVFADIASAAVAETIKVTGLGYYGGALYALCSTADLDGDGTTEDSAFVRTINGTARAPTWMASDIVTDSAFNLAPCAIRFSTGSADVWAVNTAPTDVDELWSFTDIVEAVVAPTLTGPDDGYKASVDAVLEKINPVRFTWEEVSEYTYYQLRIGTDDAVTKNYIDYSVASKREWVSIGSGTDAFEYPFVTGETYYWKVRVNNPVYGPYSEIRSFTIEVPEAAVAPAPTVTVQPAPAPEITVEAPAPVTVPAPQVTVEVPPAAIPPTPSYIWAIIAIGAILVIAVIILIVRTRRPV